MNKNGSVADVAFALGAEEGEARWWMGSLAVIKATAAQTGGQFTLVEVTENEGETPLHVHHREDETFIVLQGEVEFEVGEKSIVAGPGAVVFGPRSVPHRYVVRRGPAKMLFLLTPGGFEGLLRETSEPTTALRIPGQGEAEPDFEALPAIAERYDCELLA
ncbi:quercetin 2,3-dioxygenase [Mesorhizobium sp. VNQ89]|uniref:quercetin 2,3-dioxygenase n=1 Tax=Mesorhizobium quangtriensis TaxID=3157709 RepID=UPI0032B7848C